jgi:hypothetical protein
MKAAIAMIKKEQTSMDSIIDATKTGLWGTSLGGGKFSKWYPRIIMIHPFEQWFLRFPI